jgi:GNAT superfamily N-acetyltransferase
MQRTLPSGLVLRTLSEGYASDRDRLPDFYALVNGEGDPPHILPGLRRWTEDLMYRHPTTTQDDIFVVVDPEHDDRIASATLLIPQVWRYEEIPLPVGRPELVGTLPEYRRRGLVRELFGEVHRRSAELGHLMQGITGIPHYYRQFGYTMALELDQPVHFPYAYLEERPAGEEPAFHLRPAVAEDMSAYRGWYERHGSAFAYADVFNDAVWDYQFSGASTDNLRALQFLAIVDKSGKAVGMVECYVVPFRHFEIECGAWVLSEETSYVETFADVMRGMRDWAAAAWGVTPTYVKFNQGTPPAVQRMVQRTHAGSVRPTVYSWYLRVPDALAFFRHIAPVLERRLEGSGAHRYTGTLTIGSYNMEGIALQFAKGKLEEVRAVQGSSSFDISFPWHMLWNVVFGQHTWEEMRALLPEIYCDGRTSVLMETLFPKRPSWVRGLA